MSSPAFSSFDFMRIVPASAKSLSCRLYLEPTGTHQGMLDGGWWPRSTNAGAELPGLILMIDAIRGQVHRLVLSAAGWHDKPHTLTLDGRVVLLEYFESQPATLLTVFCADTRVDLLVVPPATDREAAEATMISAMTAGNRVAGPYPATRSVPADTSRQVWPS